MESIRTLAKELIEKHDGNWDEAIEEGIKVVLKDKTFLKEFTKPLIRHAIRDIISSIGSQQRSKLFNSVPTCPKGTSGEQLQADPTKKASLQESILQDTILDMWLNKTKLKLRNASKTDLAIEINMYGNNARWNEKRRAFLTEIYEGLSENDFVEDCFTDTELEQIKGKIHKKVDRSWNRKIVPETILQEAV